MSFQKNLAVGKVGESLIAKYMMSRGHAVLPVYEIEKSSGKGPQLFSQKENMVAPDMLVFTSKGVKFIEAKHKSVFTWHRITSRWVTGIDLRHYQDYIRISERTGIPVWLLFYHRESLPDEKDSHHCPKECPTGLFGEDLNILQRKENHRSQPIDKSRTGFLGHGNSGMVYWSEKTLIKIASKNEIEANI